MEEAYDPIEWEFLWQCLIAFDFPTQWISWIKGCGTSLSYSHKINDKTSPRHKPSRRVQQGGPLSLYFIHHMYGSFHQQK